MDQTINDSILNTIKSMLGIPNDVTNFDEVIKTHINSVFLTLQELGVGPTEGFSIQDKDTDWTDYIPEGTILNSVKSYMYLKVKMLFDPPNSTATMDSFNRIIREFEWRIMIAVDPTLNGGEENQNGN